MKRVFSLILGVALVFSFNACNDQLEEAGGLKSAEFNEKLNTDDVTRLTALGGIYHYDNLFSKETYKSWGNQSQGSGIRYNANGITLEFKGSDAILKFATDAKGIFVLGYHNGNYYNALRFDTDDMEILPYSIFFIGTGNKGFSTLKWDWDPGYVCMCTCNTDCEVCGCGGVCSKDGGCNCECTCLPEEDGGCIVVFEHKSGNQYGYVGMSYTGNSAPLQLIPLGGADYTYVITSRVAWPGLGEGIHLPVIGAMNPVFNTTGNPNVAGQQTMARAGFYEVTGTHKITGDVAVWNIVITPSVQDQEALGLDLDGTFTCADFPFPDDTCEKNKEAIQAAIDLAVDFLAEGLCDAANRWVAAKLAELNSLMRVACADDAMKKLGEINITSNIRHARGLCVEVYVCECSCNLTCACACEGTCSKDGGCNCECQCLKSASWTGRINVQGGNNGGIKVTVNGEDISVFGNFAQSSGTSTASAGGFNFTITANGNNQVTGVVVTSTTPGLDVVIGAVMSLTPGNGQGQQ